MAVLHANCHPVLFPLQVFAVLLLVASAVTIGVIDDNEALVGLRNADGMMNRRL